MDLDQLGRHQISDTELVIVMGHILILKLIHGWAHSGATGHRLLQRVPGMLSSVGWAPPGVGCGASYC